MTKVVVSQSGNADFTSITNALNAFDVNEELEIFLKSGTYCEKIFCDRKSTTIIGENASSTIIQNDCGAFYLNADGTKNGTFRSYTLWLGGEYARCENVTIKNNCQSGKIAGQGIALAVDAQKAIIKNVIITAHQDSLFTGPLPEKERLKDGFKGPRQNCARLKSVQHYQNCEITGDIDFIFGGATAFFENCTLICRANNEKIGGYIAAPSTDKGELGYLFYKCNIIVGANQNFYLARPWREYARAVFAFCNISDAINAEKFDNWGNSKNEETAFFAEYENTCTAQANKRAFGHTLTQNQFTALLEKMKTELQ